MCMYDFSIVTPSYNMLPYLQACHASIADQDNVLCQHIVCDGMSSDGTADWLRENNNILSIIEKDDGMYDALNKGYRRADGDYVAHLNCDEQYLPGILKQVKNYFETHSDIDVILCNALMIEKDGGIVSVRKAYKLRPHYISLTASLDFYTCGIFLRKHVVKDVQYNTKYKSVGDIDFMYRILSYNYTIKHVPLYSSIFFYTGHNLSADEMSILEKKQWIESTRDSSVYVRRTVKLIRFFEKLMGGAFFVRTPIEVSIYTKNNIGNRTKFTYSSVPDGINIGKWLILPFSNKPMNKRIRNAKERTNET